MSLQQVKSTQYSFDIICPTCGQQGAIVWEDAGGDRSFVSLTKDFYERISRRAPYGIELVCNKCDTIQRDTAMAAPPS